MQAALALLCGIGVVLVCAASAMFAFGQTIEFVPGVGPRLVAQAQPAQPAQPVQPAPAPIPRAAPPPPRPASVASQPSLRPPDLQVSARRSGDGHFYFEVMVNGAPMQMMFDTGADIVVLRAEEASKAGIDLATLEYTGASMTANGRTENAPVMLSSLRVGGITVPDVFAVVSRPGKLTTNLLGQTFMSRLARYNVDGDQLTLEGKWPAR